MLPQAAEAEGAFQEVTEFQSMDFFATGLNTYFSLEKNVLIVMVPILINRHVFEPSYNDLKFRVQKHYYFCTNLTVNAAAAKSLQSCPTLCDPIEGSPPGSPVPGILQARTLEWVAISFSNAWKWIVKVNSLSRVQLFETPRAAAYQKNIKCNGYMLYVNIV